MKMEMNEIKQYVQNLIPNADYWVNELEMYAAKHHVPIIEKDGIHLLQQLVRMQKPATILEIGTAIGYSALQMHAAYDIAQITTIEKNEDMFQIAKQNIQSLEKTNDIHIIHDDALHALENLIEEENKYDFIFIDAAKGQYQKFFQLAEQLANDHTMIVCDNVLFKGFVMDETLTDKKRLKSLATKINHFNEWLMNHDTYHTTILPVGDGMSISIRK